MAELKGIVRIANTDIDADKSLLFGLTGIHGVGYAMAHAICVDLGLGETKKMGSLSSDDVKRIEEFLIKGYKGELPVWILNRKRDYESGEDMHLVGSDLRLRREFDIRLMKRLKTYKGIRHSLGQPVRGQRTKSHFRRGGAVGVMKKAAKIAAAKAATDKK